MSRFTLQDAAWILGMERHHCYVCGTSHGLRQQLGRMICQRCEDVIDDVLLGSEGSRYVQDMIHEEHAAAGMQPTAAQD